MTYNNEDGPIYSMLNGKPGYVYDYFGNCDAQGYPICESRYLPEDIAQGRPPGDPSCSGSDYYSAFIACGAVMCYTCSDPYGAYRTQAECDSLGGNTMGPPYPEECSPCPGSCVKYWVFGNYQLRVNCVNLLDEAWCDRCWDPDTDSACS